MSATSPPRDVLAALPFRTSSVDVPAGMAAALELTCTSAASLPWGSGPAPHYVAPMSYPAASVALLEGLTTATGVRIEATELRRSPSSSASASTNSSRATTSTRR